ncbi:hypothetical protein M513_10042 [Trichuris suis]|uniref:Uncharacterized protein n=1 Tax=Trichuris suis TaxID=68888 RepID=A0A085LVV4_9BILA|nr:hypothetical protein M513_10042 [Trichuris suis]
MVINWTEGLAYVSAPSLERVYQKIKANQDGQTDAHDKSILAGQAIGEENVCEKKLCTDQFR